MSLITFLTFLTFLNLLILVMADLDIASMLQSTAGRRLQEEPSCLSFIHIPRTGGGAIALGRLLSAGADLVGHNDSWWYSRKCSRMVADTRRKAGSLVEGNPLPAYGKKYGRMWGPCDDQLKCSYGKGRDRHRMCYVPKQFGLKHAGPVRQSHDFFDGSCSQWHVPPGLDSIAAASYNKCSPFCVVRNPMERVLSEYNFIEKEELCCSESCLEQYVQSKLKILNGSDDCHFIPQVYYVFENGDHKKGNQICKHVLRYENFTQEFSALMGRYGLDLTVPELGQHRSRSCDVAPTLLTVQLVKKFFSADYEAFQY